MVRKERPPRGGPSPEESAGRVLQQVLEHVRDTRGLDLSGYRRATLRQRLAVRMERLGIEDPPEYLDRLVSNEGECDALIGVLAVNVTSFFREPIVFELLAQGVLPTIVAKAARRKSREIRVWSAGCATGEEAYSAAILVDKALENAPGEWRPLVFATDINEESLQAARRGVYAREQLESAKLGILDEYFVLRGDRYEVHPKIRATVRFSREDLTAPGRFCPAESVFGGFDLVLCRNVLIYFSRELQEIVLEKLYRCLMPGGTLVLGSAEFPSGPAAERLRALDARNRIFQKIATESS